MNADTRSLSAEFLGTALLLFVIVGSGIALADLTDDGAIVLIGHAIAVGAALGALITLFSPASGAHFNPAVTLGFCLTKSMTLGLAAAYAGAQIAGAISGVVVANATFDVDVISTSDTARDGLGRPGAELIATFVLVLLILGLVRSGRSSFVAPAVGAWITAVIIATVSTGFANPAVTLARTLTDTYAGIAPASAPAFLVAQFAGGALAAAAAVLLFPTHAVAVDRADAEFDPDPGNP